MPPRTNPDPVAQWKHSLRTPLNHIIGYAEMVREDAVERGASAGVAQMDEVCAIARRILESVQKAVPDEEAGHDPMGSLRAGIRPLLEQILLTVEVFDGGSGTTNADVERIRYAALDLLAFARNGALPEARSAPLRAFRIDLEAAPSGRILVVDDDQANLDLLCRRLEREGFSAVAEASGPAALARLSSEKIDLVLLDLLMPGMDGFQVLTELKSRHHTRGLPVIVLSALDDLASAVRSIEIGAEDFLTKPVDPVLLRVRIGAVLKRRRVEMECEELAESLESLLESTGEGIYGIDSQGKCTFINRAALQLLGYSREQVLGADLHELIHHSRADGSPYPASECPVTHVQQTGEPYRTADETLFRSDGTPFPVEYAASPIHRRGQVEGVVVVFSDISERKRAEEHLLQSAKLESLGVLAGGVAHDFNNLLTGILGNASLVLETLPESDENRGLLHEVVKASERAADLTRQMLAFAGRGQFVVEPVDLSTAIEDVAELLAASLPKQVRLTVNLARGLTPVQADRRQIQQLVFNLVINAGEAIGERPGIVIVETGARDVPGGVPAQPPFGPMPAGSYIFAAVQDTGTGIDPATRARIFEPFFTTKFTGRGLGLPAAMGIARAHHGTIHVETEPGRGSRFELLLPAVQACGAVQAREGAGTILVVDDEEVVRRTTRAVLERKGFDVLLAENGQAAVSVMRQHASRISLVLLDLTMPVMSGDEAVRYLHAIRHDTPILISSGYEENEVSRRVAGARVAGFVRKPYTAASLLEKIKAALAGR